jgi:hypothetical protein
VVTGRDATAALRGWADPAPARRAPVARAREFPFCDMTAVVIESEGTVQLIFARDGWQGGDGRRAVLTNVFADAATPNQLRALAEWLDGLALEPGGPA